jgi:cytochrome c oxidase subunit 2
MGDSAQVLQNALQAAGPQARHIAHLWWLMFWISTAVFAATGVAVASAVRRGIAQRRADPDTAPTQGAVERSSERTLTVGVAVAVGLTAVTVVFLFAASVWTNRAIASLGAASAVTVKVVGHQWWWEIEYEDAVASRTFRTANEIHIPVGRPVVFKVTSKDVIHSLWIPNLHGKRDLIPGYTTAIWMQADRPGVFRGQCAEFCGLQHAHMSLFVTAETEADFERWAAGQRQPAVEPTDAEGLRGREVFLHTTCTQCHTIRGTIAGATMGPDLTHVAARGSIGAGTLPNRRGHLGGWISDAQQIKPGNHMPPNALPGEDLQALLTYLGTLK